MLNRLFWGFFDWYKAVLGLSGSVYRLIYVGVDELKIEKLLCGCLYIHIS